MDNDNDDDIKFVEMPQWDAMLTNSAQPQEEAPEEKAPEEKEYDSLYSELLDKVHPRKFSVETFGLDKFNSANEIYAQLVKLGRNSLERDLVELRNRAIDELGIHFSNKKKYEYLKSILDLELYYNKQPYDKDLVAEVGAWNKKLNDSKNDIRALEQIEVQTVRFHHYKEEKEENDYKVLSNSEYLEKYPKGIYSARIIKKQQLEEEEKKRFWEQSAETYLENYPNGKFVEEAKRKIDDQKWSDKVENDNLLLLIWGLFGIVIFIIIISIVCS